jgi:hypothetical protein
LGCRFDNSFTEGDASTFSRFKPTAQGFAINISAASLRKHSLRFGAEVFLNGLHCVARIIRANEPTGIVDDHGVGGMAK